MSVDRNSPVIDQQSTAIATTFDARQLLQTCRAPEAWAIQAATPAVYLPRSISAPPPQASEGPSAPTDSRLQSADVEGISVSGINPTGFTLDYGVFEVVWVGTGCVPAK